jgi:hypothetical protein
MVCILIELQLDNCLTYLLIIKICENFTQTYDAFNARTNA